MIEMTKKEEKKLLRQLRAFLRKYWSYNSVARKSAILKSRVTEKLKKKDGTYGKRIKVIGHTCAKCGKVIPVKPNRRPAIEVHHVHPLGKLTLINIVSFIFKLFCDEDNLMILCHECHQEITQEERNKTGRKQ